MTAPDYDYFQSIPWCARLLADPDVVIIPTAPREKMADTENELTAGTLKTEKTIPAWLTFHKVSNPAPGGGSSSSRGVGTVYNLLSLASGVNSYPHMVAGGIIGVILDECMGILGRMHKELRYTVTATLNIRYLKAVPTPGIYLVTVTLGDVRGRKSYYTASMENGEGTVLATAESVWLKVPAKL